MPLNVIFISLMIAACAPALIWGGWEGRTTCLMLFIAAFATFFGATTLKPWVSLPDISFVIDMILLLGLLQVAIRTDRYWPLWICALHMLSVMTYAAWQFAPGSGKLFKAISGVWSIPELIILCVGPILDIRHLVSRKDAR